MEQSFWSLSSNGTSEGAENEPITTSDPLLTPSKQEVAGLIFHAVDRCLDQQMPAILLLLADFATMFKRRRIQLGISQNRVGQIMKQFAASIGGTRYENRGLSQTYVSNFEELRMTPLSMIKLLPLFQRIMQAMLTEEYQTLFPESLQLSCEFDVNELFFWENRAEILFMEASNHCLPESTVHSWIYAVRSPLTPKPQQPRDQSHYFLRPDSAWSPFR
ncbi:hypothetical protein QR680_018782 [Steinernema hermaphroditum]|uniref:POU-specific domain-containing protein n=1 Tax=Steinernema hermaphroditum TaxID=289476 RepID=A0AA39HK98_9BILA|nr:hypothetical protein QR680_018782 [Steinernema hermaphroditum]